MATYEQVNRAWGDVTLPPITAAEAAKIYNKLARKFGGHARMRKGRRCWAAPRGTDTRIDRSNGLPRMVHDASHHVFAQLHPTFLTHGTAHAALELQMIQTVLDKGWHVPRAKAPKPTTDQRRALTLARTEAAIKRWETKAKRAATALRKLRIKHRRLARLAGAVT